MPRIPLFRTVMPVVRLAVLIIILTPAACGNLSQAKRPNVSHDNAISVPSPAVSTSTPIANDPTKLPVETQANPVRLLIPAVGLSANVESVGLQSDGELETPPRNPWQDVGWYNLGPRPGEQGSAVIDGHLDRPGGYPAVFWYLHNIAAGDDVMVVNKAGKTFHFRVTHFTYYAPQQAPLQAIFGNQGGEYLNLITCAGDWIPSQHQTTLRLVVYTTLIQSPH